MCALSYYNLSFMFLLLYIEPDLDVVRLALALMELYLLYPKRVPAHDADSVKFCDMSVYFNQIQELQIAQATAIGRSLLWIKLKSTTTDVIRLLRHIAPLTQFELV